MNLLTWLENIDKYTVGEARFPLSTLVRSSITTRNVIEVLNKAKRREALRLQTLACLGILILTLVVLPVATEPRGQSNVFFAVLSTIGIFGSCISAILLEAQSRVINSGRMYLLAGGMISASVAATLYALVLPVEPHGLPEKFHTVSGAVTWMFMLLHLSLISSILLFLFTPRRIRREQVYQLSFALCGGFVLAVIVGLWVPLPLMVEKTGNHWTWLYQYFVGPSILLVSVLGLFFGLTQEKRGIIESWLVVTLFIITCDISLSTISGGFWTAGWYAARLESTISMIVTMITLIGISYQATISLAAATEMYDRQASTDSLTDLPNRRWFEPEAWIIIASNDAASEPTSLAFVDIDNFKKFNDTYGHHVGDKALQVLAKTMKDTFRRESDRIARWGGEEFVVLFSRTNAKNAMKRVDESREILCGQAIDEADAHISFSAGIVQHEPGETFDDFLDRADKALYEAKKKGRGRSVIA